MCQDKAADAFFKAIGGFCPKAVVQVLNTATDDIHVIQAEYVVFEQFAHDKSLADAHCVGLGLGGIGRDVGGAHPEQRLWLDDIRCLKIFRGAV